jgi:hypothetical protein
VLGSVGGAALVLGATGLATTGRSGWPTAVLVIVAGLILLIGGRRIILRPAVDRVAPDELLCRFTPWYEGLGYIALLIPVVGAVGVVTAGPPWVRYSALALLALTPVVLGGLAMARRKSYLLLTPATLTLRRMGPLTEIRRADIVAVGDGVGPRHPGGQPGGHPEPLQRERRRRRGS